MLLNGVRHGPESSHSDYAAVFTLVRAPIPRFICKRRLMKSWGDEVTSEETLFAGREQREAEWHREKQEQVPEL